VFQSDNDSLLISSESYVLRRERYNYNSTDCSFEIIQTGELANTGSFTGIFGREVPTYCPNGIILRKFENIVQEVFKDCHSALSNSELTSKHISNLKHVASAIIYWKMASQGGRSKIKAANLLERWDANTANQLLEAYEKKDLALFRIGGVRIPTATTFMRFLYPDEFGIMDSRVVGTYTQPNNLTTLSLRNDGYIIDTKKNIEKYYSEYMRFLLHEKHQLDDLETKFTDFDENGNKITTSFRVCDVEMALSGL